jgi:hypothetical protein
MALIYAKNSKKVSNKKHAILNSELRVAITLHQQTKNQIMFLLSKHT